MFFPNIESPSLLQIFHDPKGSYSGYGVIVDANRPYKTFYDKHLLMVKIIGPTLNPHSQIE